MDAYSTIKDKVLKRHVEKYGRILKSFVDAVHDQDYQRAEDAAMDFRAFVETLRHGGYAPLALEMAEKFDALIGQLRAEGFCDFILERAS